MATLHERIACWLNQRGATAQYEIADNSDGRGPYVAQWISAVTQPTANELPDDATVTAWQAQVAALPQDVALGKAVLRTHADGSVELISGPLVIGGTTNGAYELWVDSDTGLVLSTLDHASPRKSKAEKDADKKAKKDKLAAIKAEPNTNKKLEMLLEVLNLKTP